VRRPQVEHDIDENTRERYESLIRIQLCE